MENELNPYKFNEQICVAFSGGRSSGFMLKQIIDAGMEDGSIVCFCNTGKEEEATLEFVRDCSVYWDIPIVWLEYDLAEDGKSTFKIVDFESASRNGEPFMKLIRKRQYLPNVVTRFCTIEMKIRTTAKYCKHLGLDIGENDSIVGFRYDEPRRVAKLKDKSRAPMYRAKHTKADVDKFWHEQPFKLNLPLINGVTKHGNCDLCFLKSGYQVQSLIAEKPSRAIWWAEAEAEARGKKQTGSVFVNDRPDYQTMYNYVMNQQDWIGWADENEESIDCFCGD